VRGVGRALARTASDFWKGFRYPFRGIRFVYGVHPGLVAIWI